MGVLGEKGAKAKRGKVRNLTLTSSSRSLKQEATTRTKEKEKAKESLTKGTGKLTHPSLHLSKARESSNSFPRNNSGAAIARKRVI